MIIGIVNNVRTCAHDTARGGTGGLIAGGLALIALAALGTAVYHALEGVLVGAAATSGEANRTVAWLVGGAVALAVLLLAGFYLVTRVRDRITGLEDGTTRTEARAFTLEVDRALAARRLELDAAEAARLEAAAHTARLEGPRQPPASRRQRPRKVASTRTDRPAEAPLEDAERAPVDLDARGWSA